MSGVVGVETVPSTPNGTNARRRIRLPGSDVGAVVALLFLLLFCLAGVVFTLPHSPVVPDPAAVGLSPNGSHWFGTDGTGFDVFARTIDAAHRDVPIAVSGALISLVLGVPVGLFAASGWFGEIVMRALDGFSALPILVLVVVAIQLLGGSALDIVFAIAVVNVPRFARLTRAEAVALRSARFVEAAVAAGCSPVRIAIHHVFRNAYGVVLVQASLAAANAIGVIAALNYLGVGVRPPDPTWGGMIHDGTTLLIDGKWWAATFPALAVFLVVIAFNVVADAIEARVERYGGAHS